MGETRPVKGIFMRVTVKTARCGGISAGCGGKSSGWRGIFTGWTKKWGWEPKRWFPAGEDYPGKGGGSPGAGEIHSRPGGNPPGLGAFLPVPGAAYRVDGTPQKKFLQD